MHTPSIPISPLCRVSLDLGVQSNAGAGRPGEYTFIVGVGSAGLSPFEYALLEKRVGDRIRLEIDPRRMEETFEHLQPPVAAPFDADPVVIEAVVTAVSRAGNREIVKAMAAATGGCGGECGCGCGCGGHCSLD
jgi:hypothetical protein